MIDFHNHLIPGVDDGAESLDQALSGVAEMWNQGFRHIITTPHFRASTVNDQKKFSEQIRRIDERWAELKRAVLQSFPDLELERGVELALDEPLSGPIDERVKLGKTKFMLVEFPGFSIPPNSAMALAHLAKRGVVPIVAHPERYLNLDSNWDLLRDWKRAGAYLQLNAGSIVGVYGRRIQQTAWGAVRTGLMDYMCSDYHSRGECVIGRAKRDFEASDSTIQFTVLTSINGRRMLEGQSPAPVPAARVRRAGWWTFFSRTKSR